VPKTSLPGFRKAGLEKSFLKCLPVLGRYEVVDEWVDCGVQVQKHSSHVEELLIDRIIQLL
jgi:hypothetical protein